MALFIGFVFYSFVLKKTFYQLNAIWPAFCCVTQTVLELTKPPGFMSYLQDYRTDLFHYNLLLGAINKSSPKLPFSLPDIYILYLEHNLFWEVREHRESTILIFLIIQTRNTKIWGRDAKEPFSGNFTSPADSELLWLLANFIKFTRKDSFHHFNEKEKVVRLVPPSSLITWESETGVWTVWEYPGYVL